MTKYINAGWLYGTLCNLWDKTDSEDFEKGVFETIINAPAADVVEVVRCKDCKASRVYGKITQWLACESVMEGQATDPDGYCYLGERKEP